MSSVEYRFALLTNGCCCFSGEIETSEVCVPFSIIDKTVATNPLVVGDGVVSTGIQMDEIDHVGECLEQSCREGFILETLLLLSMDGLFISFFLQAPPPPKY